MKKGGKTERQGLVKKQTKKNEKRLWNVSKTKRKKGMKNERKLKIDTRKKK